MRLVHPEIPIRTMPVHGPWQMAAMGSFASCIARMNRVSGAPQLSRRECARWHMYAYCAARRTLCRTHRTPRNRNKGQPTNVKVNKPTKERGIARRAGIQPRPRKYVRSGRVEKAAQEAKRAVDAGDEARSSQGRTRGRGHAKEPDGPSPRGPFDDQKPPSVLVHQLDRSS